MGRSARLKIEHNDCWYFLHAKLADVVKKKNILAVDGCGEKLLECVERYSSTFGCELAGVFISKGHYGLVVKFLKFKKLSTKTLSEKAQILYEDKSINYNNWGSDQWVDFNHRLYDVAHFMKGIQTSFARWYNKKYVKSGMLWSERFKSTILATEEAAFDALTYLEAGPIRENFAKDLSSYPFSSFYLRETLKVNWLIKVEENFSLPKDNHIKNIYTQILKNRSDLPVTSKEILKNEKSKNFMPGCYLTRQRYFIDGLVIGNAEDVKFWINKLKKTGKYTKKSMPLKIEIGTQYVLREQRSHFVNYK